MTPDERRELQRISAQSQEIWDANADAWHQRIVAGGGWQTRVIAPLVEAMLDIRPGENVLDIACGDGFFSRRLAAKGAYVVASDFSARMIDLALDDTSESNDLIEYHVIDATREHDLVSLAGSADRRFHAGVCINALMDMPAIDPLFRAVARLLKPDGRFVFTVMHPCFNGQAMAMQAELPDYADKPSYSIKVSGYLTAEQTTGVAIREQPRQQFYWHRPLHQLLNSAFAAGLVMDRIEEPRITAATASPGPFDWANYDMPPLLFVRLRPRG